MGKSAFGENLKRIRKDKGMTQKQLSDRIRISVPNISRWENNESYPQVIWVYEIAKALGVNPEELVKVK